MNRQLLKLTELGLSPLEAYGITRKIATIQALEEWAKSTPPADPEERQGWTSAQKRVLDISRKSDSPDTAAESLRSLLDMIPGPRTNRDRGRLRAFNEALDAIDKGGHTGTDMAIAEPPPPGSSSQPPGSPDMRKDKGDAWSPGSGSRIPQDYGGGTTRMSSQIDFNLRWHPDIYFYDRVENPEQSYKFVKIDDQYYFWPVNSVLDGNAPHHGEIFRNVTGTPDLSGYYFTPGHKDIRGWLAEEGWYIPRGSVTLVTADRLGFDTDIAEIQELTGADNILWNDRPIITELDSDVMSKKAELFPASEFTIGPNGEYKDWGDGEFRHGEAITELKGLSLEEVLENRKPEDFEEMGVFGQLMWKQNQFSELRNEYAEEGWVIGTVSSGASGDIEITAYTAGLLNDTQLQVLARETEPLADEYPTFLFLEDQENGFEGSYEQFVKSLGNNRLSKQASYDFDKLVDEVKAKIHISVGQAGVDRLEISNRPTSEYNKVVFTGDDALFWTPIGGDDGYPHHVHVELALIDQGYEENDMAAGYWNTYDEYNKERDYIELYHNAESLDPDIEYDIRNVFTGIARRIEVHPMAVDSRKVVFDLTQDLTASYNRWVGGQNARNSIRKTGIKEPESYNLGTRFNQETFESEPWFFDRPVGDRCKLWIDTEGNPYFWKIGDDLRPPHMAAVKMLRSRGIEPEVAGSWEAGYNGGLINVYATDDHDLELARIAFPEVEGIMNRKEYIPFDKVARSLTELPPAFDARSLFDLVKFVQFRGKEINWEVFKSTSKSPDRDLDSMLEILTEIGVMQSTDSEELGGSFLVDTEQVRSLLSDSKGKGNGSIPEKGEEAVRKDSRYLRGDLYEDIMYPDQVDQIPWDRVSNTPNGNLQNEKFVLDLVNQDGYFWDGFMSRPELHHLPLVYYVAEKQGVIPDEDDEVWGKDPRSGEGIASGYIDYVKDKSIEVYSDKDMLDDRDYQWLSGLFGENFSWNGEVVKVNLSSDFVRKDSAESRLPDGPPEYQWKIFVMSPPGDIIWDEYDSRGDHDMLIFDFFPDRDEELMGLGTDETQGYLRGVIGSDNLTVVPYNLVLGDEMGPELTSGQVNKIAELIADLPDEIEEVYVCSYTTEIEGTKEEVIVKLSEYLGGISDDR